MCHPGLPTNYPGPSSFVLLTEKQCNHLLSLYPVTIGDYPQAMF